MAENATNDADNAGGEANRGKANQGEEMKLGGNIALVGFEILDPAELIILKKIVGNYVRKLGNNGNYQEMKLTLQQHPHGKSFKHEITAIAIFKEGRFNSEATDWNVYNAVSQVCEKILQEVLHSIRKEGENKGEKIRV